VTANLTGATRLLLTGATTLPIVIGYLSRRTGQRRVPLRLAPSRRLELGILLITSVFGIQIIIRGSLTVLDGLVLITLYVLYTRRVQGTPEEDAALVGVSASLLTLPTRYIRPIVIAMILGAGAVVLLIANPFADDLLVTGASVGIDPYLLVQSVVPVTTEAPEILVVAILVKNQRPAQGLALFLAASVSQSTLGIGALPFAYLAGGGGMSMAVAPREQVELALTNALTLFVVAALCTRRPERVDALFVAGLFAMQILYPSPLVRLAATFVLLVFAISLLASRRRFIPAILRAAWGSRRTR
jgi:cation:H+ antiporter